MQDKPMIRATVRMDIIDRIEKAILAKYGEKPYNITRYIRIWHETDYNWDNQNFHLITPDPESPEISLVDTLDTMDEELLLEIAVDLDLEVPGLIYRVTEIKELLPENYKDVGVAFKNAHKKVYSAPDEAISTAYSALETIIKKICEHDSIENCGSKTPLNNLVSHILKQFKFSPDKDLNKNITNIGSGFLTITQAITYIRSNHTQVHGKTEKEIIDDPIYAMLVVNSVATFGLFLLNYYAKHYEPKFFEKPEPEPRVVDLDSEIPF